MRYQKVFGGAVDMDLSPRGHEQAATLAKFRIALPEEDMVVSFIVEDRRMLQEPAPPAL